MFGGFDQGPSSNTKDKQKEALEKLNAQSDSEMLDDKNGKKSSGNAKDENRNDKKRKAASSVETLEKEMHDKEINKKQK